MPADFRIVIDTNTFLRGVLSEASAAAKLLGYASNRAVIPLLSKPVLDEYRAVLRAPDLITRFPNLFSPRVGLMLQKIIYVAETVRTPRSRFVYRRDPDDEKFIELAIELNATHIVTSDKDLLDLPNSSGEAGKRFRQRLQHISVLEAAQFLDENDARLRG